jgi:hypothetical protein
MKLLKQAVYLLVIFVSISAHAVDNRLSPLGINTNEVMDINSSVPFVDLFKLATPFDEARPWLTKGNIQYDSDGWPTNLNGGQAGTRFINNLPAKTLPRGIYTVLYKGHGKIKYGGDIRLLRSYYGKDLIQLRPNHERRITATLTIIESDKKNYLRDIRVIMPGGICKDAPTKWIKFDSQCGSKPFLKFTSHHPRVLFNPDYVNFMKDFRVIRFMNMAGITRNNLSKWDQRPKMTDATWGGKEGVRGAPIEVMVELANLIDADPWFNLPHRANDDFVLQTARYVKTHLKPTLKSYIEYTNEAWNGLFTQAHFVKNQGVHQGLDANRTYAGFKYYSRRSVEIFKIWEQEFGNTQRLVRVMGGMTTNVPMTHMLLGYQEAFRHVDALAIAPYFHADQAAQKNVKSVDDLFALLKSPRNKYSIPNTLKVLKRQSDVLKRYGVEMIAYEGGQHLVAYKTHSKKEGTNPILIKANKDKRMANLYYQFLQGWKKAGGKLFVAFSAPREYNHIGSWGIKEYITQSINEAPKYQGLMYFKKNNRCWWRNCATTRPIARMGKPKFNPGASEMTRRFKPARPITRPTVVLATTENPKVRRRGFLDN